MTEAELIERLQATGLATAGSSETRFELAKRYGVSRWRGFSDVVYLPRAPLFPELKEPWYFSVEPTVHLPPTDVGCRFAAFDVARKNHECALERLSGLFGKPATGGSVNTWNQTWTFERMSLSILTFIREKTQARSPLYERYPDLWDQCSITVNRDWVMPLTAGEPARIEHPDAVLALPAGVAMSGFMAPWDRGFERVITASYAPALWTSGSLIGWRSGGRAAVYERTHCTGMIHMVCSPARGAGYSQLQLKLRNIFSEGCEAVTSAVIRSEDWRGLEGIARHCAEFWALPFERVEYLDD